MCTTFAAPVLRKHLRKGPSQICPGLFLRRELTPAVEHRTAMTCAASAVRKYFYPVVDQAVLCRVDLSLHLAKSLLQCDVIAVERCNAITAFIANEQMLLDPSQLRLRQAT